MPGFEVIQHPKEGLKGRFIVVSAVEAGFETCSADNLLRYALFHGISALTHEADAGDQSFVPANQTFEVRKKWFSHVLLQIL